MLPKRMPDAVVGHLSLINLEHEEIEFAGVDLPLRWSHIVTEYLVGFVPVDAAMRSSAVQFLKIEPDESLGLIDLERLALLQVANPLLVTHQVGRFVGDARSPEGVHETLDTLNVFRFRSA